MVVTSPAGRARPRTAVRAARVVTEVFTPAVQMIGLLALVGAASGHDRRAGLAWGLLASVFTAVVPYGIVLLQVRRGTLGDHHVTTREERLKPFGIALGLVLTGLAVLAAAGAPRQVLAVVVALLTGLVVTTAVTTRWKVSVHAAVAAGTATILSLVFGWPAAPAWPVVAAVGWSRVVLREHTLAQVLAGVPLGVLTSGAAFLLTRGSPG